MNTFIQQATAAAQNDIFTASGGINLPSDVQRYYQNELVQIHEAKITADTEKNVYLRPPREALEKAENRRQELLKELAERAKKAQAAENEKHQKRQTAINAAESLYKKEFLPLAEKLLTVHQKADGILKAAGIHDTALPSPRPKSVIGAYSVDCEAESMIDMLKTIVSKLKA